MGKVRTWEKVEAVLKEHKASEELFKAVADLIEPKGGGARLNVDEVACMGEDGNIEYLKDTYFNKWLPVFNEKGECNFYTVKDSQLKVTISGTEVGLTRTSRVGERERKRKLKVFQDSKNAIMEDMLEDKLSSVEAKDAIQAAAEARDTVTVPDDLGGVKDERPCPVEEPAE